MTGASLTLLMGPTIPIPVPRILSEALQSAEVTHSDEGRSGFQLVFQVGRSGVGHLQDYFIVKNPLFRTFNRVILILTIKGNAKVLMDGIITNQQLSPDPDPGRATFTITGEDVSVMMDRDEQSTQHPAQDEATIVRLLIFKYAKFGLVPLVIPPPTLDRPLLSDRTPAQQGTDLAYIQELAARFAYVFYIVPGPAPGSNLAYWGPPIRFGIPQKAITVNMGAYTNAESLSFQHDALAATRITGQVQDRQFNRSLPVRSFVSLRLPLALESPLLTRSLAKQQFRDSGRTIVQALSSAQSTTDRSLDNVVSVSGELDTVRYGNLLQLRQLVGLRGAGYTYDGLYYVKKVTHQIKKGTYTQSFTITREGLTTTVPAVRV